MKRFRTAVFGGYQKTEVDEYVNFLVKELEDVKAEANQTLQEQENKYGFDQDERKQLQAQIEELKENERAAEDRHRQEIEDFKSRLNQYEESYNEFSKMISSAKKEADTILSEAKRQADELLAEAEKKSRNLLESAQEEVLAYQNQAEGLIKRKREANEKDYERAQNQIKEYVDSINKAQSALVDAYNELGAVVSKLPIRMETVLSKKTSSPSEESES